MTKYEIKNTTQFKKDYKLAKRRGLNLNLLKDIVIKLANGETLDPKHKDHSLSGNWTGHRECHISKHTPNNFHYILIALFSFLLSRQPQETILL